MYIGLDIVIGVILVLFAYSYLSKAKQQYLDYVVYRMGRYQLTNLEFIFTTMLSR